MNLNEDFIKSTAKDYDMEIAEVEKIANNSESYKEFYDELEFFIKNRTDG